MMRLIGRSNRLGRLSSPDRQTDHQVIHLNVGRCFLDSLDAIKAHPALFAGASLISVLLAAASGMLLIGSLCAGLLVMFLKAMEGKQPALADLFGPFPHFPRFLFIVVFCLGITIAGLVGTFLPVILINGGHSLWSGEFPRQVYGQIVQFSNASRGYRLALFLLVTGAAYLLVPRSFVGARCLYMLALAADQKLPADEAYMASKRAAQNYGFPQHALLTVILLWVGAAGLEGYAGLIKPWAGLLGLGLPMFLLQPLALGLLASAYRQTLQVEAHRRRLREEHVVEMRDELQMAREMQMGLLPAASPDIKGYEVGDICIPANAVCGDYYTYHWLDDRYFVIVVADVCGKAMRAAVTALRFNEMLRYECRDRTDAAEILAGLDTSLEGQLPDHAFITCCIAVLDTRTHTVEMANAGHSEPYLFSHARQEAEAVPLRGHPLGLPRILRVCPDLSTDFSGQKRP
jgi:hypothetical protein